MSLDARDSHDPKVSILKRSGGLSFKTKTVRFDTERSSGHNHCVRPLSAMEANMVTQSWLAKASKRKEVVSREAPELRGDEVPASEEEFEVEAIRDHRKCGGDYLYLLKWKGYGEEDNTWEPSSNLFCTSILDAYRQEHNLSPALFAETPTPPNANLPKISASKSTEHNKRKHKIRSRVVFKAAPAGGINVILKQKKRHRDASKKKKKKRRRKLIVSIALDDDVNFGQQSSGPSLIKKKKKNSSYRKSGSPSTQSDIPFIHDRPPLTPTPSIEHRLCCLRHDHPYCMLGQDPELSPTKFPFPIVLTPPHSGNHFEESSFCTHDTGVNSIDISPPPTPLSPKMSPLKMHFEPLANENDLNSPLHCSSFDYPRNSSPLPSSPLSNAFKLKWSSASSLSSDFEACSREDDVPLASKPRQEAKQKQNVTFTYKRTKPYRMRLNKVFTRWRKGPLPLPRSFSKWQSTTTNSLLQTRAAKLEGISPNLKNDTKSFCIDLGRFSLPLKHKARSNFEQVKMKRILAPNDENCCDQATPSQTTHEQSPQDSGAICCAYKEQLMEWQYELNRQRDGTDDIIFVENDLDMAPPPTDFNYVCANVYREGVPNPSNPEVSSSLCGCECYNLGRKCGPKSEFCCAHMAGSKFAYSPAGKVKVPPGTPIYECNTECSCPSDCLNRIVQLGRKMPLCIFRTDGRGWGVKTVEPIKPNTFVTEYVGEVITNEEAEKRGEKCDAEGITYLFDLDFEDENSAFTVDAKGYGNISHFFNHSCDPNLVVYSVWIDTLDKRLPRLAFFTTRNISVGEELTFDYQMNRDSTSGPKMPCLCGSNNCLGYIN